MIEQIYNSDDAAVLWGDNLEYMRTLPDQCVDLVMCSPPYEDARTYGIDFKHKNDAWVLWAFERYMECYRICRGLVCWVVEGKTRNFQYSATPILLMAALHEAGVKLRKPLIFHRVGISGGGGPDWLRPDTEFMVCASHGRLPWSDNTAMGHPPRWAPGGEMSHRVSDGTRVNQWGHSIDSGATVVDVGGVVRSKGKRPSHKLAGTRLGTGQNLKGSCGTVPKIANPGNVIWTDDGLGDLTKHIVGGGVMGSPLAHSNEAPYPESLCNHVIRSFCPPGGVVFDPFIGSGTTIASAIKAGRHAIGIDVRKSQAELTVRRIAEARAFVTTNPGDVICSLNPPASTPSATPAL